ncbi:MAG: indole-3-glycerol-phosphate synthase [Elusimicrobia bacterium]|nr:indole-3-glycerol-phosphate synthase [Elusimicrobiota bacterium]
MKAPGILERIAASTAARVARAKKERPERELREEALRAPAPRDFMAALGSGRGLRVIAEVKLASPSAGEIGRGLDPARAARDYEANGAAAVSILTEPEFFAGSLEHLAAARRAVAVPLLMKDFVLEEYQLLQARASGADCVLLIMRLLGRERTREFVAAGRRLGLSALVEVRDEAELEDAAAAGAALAGVNNRDLATLEVSLDVSRRLGPLGRRLGLTLVSESGFSRREELVELAGLGFSAFLVGTSFLRGGRPGEALAALLGAAR